MASKITKTILPPILGISLVLGLLIIFNLIVNNGDGFSKPDNGFFKYFVPLVTIIAVVIQAYISLPIWNRFKTQKKLLGLSLFGFTGLICVFSGLIFGFIFWEKSLGINELIAISLTGIIAFTSYWSINLLTLKQLDKA